MQPQTSTLLNRRRIRRSFGKISEAVKMPNLIEVQRHSYDQYLQMYIKPEERSKEGLQEVFLSIFPIKDFSGKSMLEFVSYSLEEPKYDVEECQQRGLTYASGLRVRKKFIYKPNQLEDFKISRGKFWDFLTCPKCFYLDRVAGLDVPKTPQWTLNETTDLLLKKEFDHLRALQKPHRLFIENKFLI